jgi:hypothetical protein
LRQTKIALRPHIALAVESRTGSIALDVRRQKMNAPK